ncbi:MAG: RpiB/LacA/LacB family sugar-phosphate isomerase [Verrucomicrobiota bacterium]
MIPSLPHSKSIGIASDHGGYELKKYLIRMLNDEGYEVVNFGNDELNLEDDYPDFIIPLARAVAEGKPSRGIAICGSGVGASIVANKIPGIRAALIHEKYSAHQGVEDDDLNIICLGGLVVSHPFAWILVEIFLKAQFSKAPRHQRRVNKILALENTHSDFVSETSSLISN